MNGIPTFICAGCQESVRRDLDQAAVNYESIVPNYPNGLVLGYWCGAGRGSRLGWLGLRDQLHLSLWSDSNRLLGRRGGAKGHRQSHTFWTSDYPGPYRRQRSLR
jgi:hypothetical protein